MHPCRQRPSWKRHIMKRALVKLVGAIVSIVVGTIVQPASAVDPRAAPLRNQLSQPDAQEKTRAAPPVPRGNLRGDITNNARSRFERLHSGPDDRSLERNPPGSR
jgi:hypothetical protein